MSTEEPAWKAAFRHAIYMASYNAIPTVDEVLEHLLPHIQAAEERGRREAQARLDAVSGLHENVQWHCGTCADEYGSAAPWPCPTARLLDPEFL